MEPEATAVTAPVEPVEPPAFVATLENRPEKGTEDYKQWLYHYRVQNLVKAREQAAKMIRANGEKNRAIRQANMTLKDADKKRMDDPIRAAILDEAPVDRIPVLKQHVAVKEAKAKGVPPPAPTEPVKIPKTKKKSRKQVIMIMDSSSEDETSSEDEAPHVVIKRGRGGSSKKTDRRSKRRVASPGEDYTPPPTATVAPAPAPVEDQLASLSALQIRQEIKKMQLEQLYKQMFA